MMSRGLAIKAAVTLAAMHRKVDTMDTSVPDSDGDILFRMSMNLSHVIRYGDNDEKIIRINDCVSMLNLLEREQ